jgi:hypothetical protein
VISSGLLFVPDSLSIGYHKTEDGGGTVAIPNNAQRGVNG